MKVTTERLEQCQVNVFIELEAAEVDKKLRQTARNISLKFNVPGYRRGHAPFAAVIRKFGQEAIQQEALDGFGEELYDRALQELPYEPYQPGELKDVEWDPFRMTVVLPIKPEVDLGDYRAVRVPLEVMPVTDEQIEAYLAQVQGEQAQWVPVERPAALGDQVVIDSEGKIGDKEVWSEEGHEMVLDAKDTAPVPGFHQEIAGMSAGEDEVFVLTFPQDDPQKDVAGNEVTCRVHLHAVKEQNLLPIDDELAMMVGDYDTLDALRAAVRQRLETEAQQKAGGEYVDNVLEAMIDKAVKIEYPPQAVDREADLALNRMEQNLAASGIKLDVYLKMMGKTRDAYKLEFRPAAEGRLKKRLALIDIAKKEGLKVESEEIEAEVKRLGQMLGGQAGDMREFLASAEGHLSVADDLIMAKVQERVIQIAKGEGLPLEVETEVEAQAEVKVESEAEGSAAEAPSHDEAQPQAEPPASSEAN